jgi:hypothetical protein
VISGGSLVSDGIYDRKRRRSIDHGKTKNYNKNLSKKRTTIKKE